MTGNILPDCSSRSLVKQVDDEVTKRNRCRVFQELITMLRCCIQHKVLSLSLQEQESNIKIYIRKYRVVSWWEEIKAWHKENRARMTLYNITCKMPLFCWLWWNLWLSCYHWYPSHGIMLIMIAVYVTSIFLNIKHFYFLNEDNLLSKLLAFFPINDII